jgi:DNA-binding response OmpR family regulator
MQTILLVSRDHALQSTRSLVFRSAGYKTYLSADLCSALTIAHQVDLVLLGHTLEPREQDDFVQHVQETNPSVFVLSLRNGPVAPQMLLSTCESFLSCQPGAARYWVIEDGVVLPWSSTDA